jgi:hypothetical protein
MLRRQVLYIVYQPFMEEEAAFYIHPYLLKEWRNRWYVFCRAVPGAGDHQMGSLEKTGFIQRNDGLWNFPLDRISALTPVDDTAYLPNDLFDPTEWFEDIVGVTKPEGAEPIDIEIEVDAVASFYIETKPLHQSQALIRRDEERAFFALRLIPNHEILNDLLAYGKYIRGVSPESFRAMLAGRQA